MASPTTDGSALNNAWSGATSATVTLTTTQTNDLIYLVVAMAHATTLPTVSTVADVAGLTWTKRKAWTVAGTSADIGLELWTAPSTGILTGDVITVTAGLTVNAGIIIACGLHGVFALATPFDPDAGLPYENQVTNSASLPTVTYSTAKADDLLLGVFMGDKSSSGGSAPSGWTQVQNGTHFGTSRFIGCGLYFKSVSATQSSQTFSSAGVFTALDAIGDVDAVTADNPSTAYTLAITTGVYTVSGIATGLRAARTTAPTTGAYTIAGQNVGLLKAKKVQPVTGIYLVAGQAATFARTRTIAPATGAYVVSGKATAFGRTYRATPVTGAYVIEGHDIDATTSSFYHATFAEFNNPGFVDWGSADFQSFLAISQSDEQVDTREQVPYVYTFLKETADSDETSEGATITGYWDWANDASSKRVTQPQEIYNFRNGFLVCARRHKMRGRGRQLQLRYDSVSGKNFNLLGWAVFYTHNAHQ